MRQTISIIDTPGKRVSTVKNVGDVDLKQVINSAVESCDDKKVKEHDQTNIGSNNNNKNRCPRCFHQFPTSQRLLSHLKRQNPCESRAEHEDCQQQVRSVSVNNPNQDCQQQLRSVSVNNPNQDCQQQLISVSIKNSHQDCQQQLSYIMNQCSNCLQTFSTVNRLESHLKRKIPCKPNNNQISPVKFEIMTIAYGDCDLLEDNGNKHLHHIDRFPCNYCHKEFTRKDNLTAHLKKNRCLFMKNQINVDQPINVDQLKAELKAELIAELKEKSQIFEEKSKILEKKIAELTEKPSVTNQIKGETPFEPLLSVRVV